MHIIRLQGQLNKVKVNLMPHVPGNAISLSKLTFSEFILSKLNLQSRMRFPEFTKLRCDKFKNNAFKMY